MDMIPITISIPKHLYAQLNRYVPARQRSSFATDAISNKIIKIRKIKINDPWGEFFNLTKKVHSQPNAFNQWLEHRHEGLA